MSLTSRVTVMFVPGDAFNCRVDYYGSSVQDLNRVNNYVYTSMQFYDEGKGFMAKSLGMNKHECVVEFFDRKTRMLPVGLIPRVAKLLRTEFGVGVKIGLAKEIDDMFRPPHGPVTEQAIRSYASTLNIHNAKTGKPLVPYDHQIRLATRALNGRRISLLACTSAGKSLSMMIIARYLLEREHRRRVLIIVPSTNLVEQLFSDFHDDYGWDHAGLYCTLLHSTSTDKLTKSEKARLEALNLGEEAKLKPITISTWQTLQNKRASFFEVFDAVIVDEAHSTRGQKLREILSLCENANNFKVGVSGTLPDDGLDAGYIESGLGRKEEIVHLHELVEKGILTPVQVEAVFIPYPPKLRPKIKSMHYDTEFDMATENSSRKDIIDMLIRAGKITTAENTVILFRYIDNLEMVMNFLKERHPEFKYFVIKGDVPTDEREEIRKSIEASTGNIIIATYGCMQQGVNIKLLHNLIMADPAKSPYMVVQSIGRIVRKHPAKPLARVFDLVDDASYMGRPWRGKPAQLQMNGLLRQFAKFRKSYYDADKIPVNRIDLEGIYCVSITEEDIMERILKAIEAAKAAKAKKEAAKGKQQATGSVYKKKFFLNPFQQPGVV